MTILGSCGGGGGGHKGGIAWDPILCGENIIGWLTTPAGSPPALSSSASTQHFQIQNLSPTAGAIVITLTSISGDSNLHLGAPGTAAKDTAIANYYLSSTDPGLLDIVTINPLGVTDTSGNLDTTYTLADFLAAPSDPVFVVAAFAAPTAFAVQIDCIPPPATTS